MDKTMKLYLDRIAGLPEPNKGYLLGFKKQCEAAGTSESRTREYLRLLIEAAKLFKGKDMKKASSEDIDDILAAFRNKRKMRRQGHIWIETKERLAESTVKGFIISLKLFYKRIFRSDEYPACVKHLKVGQHEGLGIEAKDLLTYDEIVAMSEAAKTARDKALVWTWIATGARASELLNIQRKDVKFLGDEAEIIIHTEKTQRRKEKGDKTRLNTIQYGAVYLGQWLDQLKPKPDDFVFVNIGNKGHGKRMNIGNLNKLFKDIAQRAGIDKPVKIHLGRHTCAYLFKRRGVSESAMCKYLGWSEKSSMPRHYGKMDQQGAVNAIKEQVYGKKTDGRENGEAIIHPCPKCNFRNLGEPEFCQGCGIDLKNLDVKKEIEERKQMEREANIGNTILEILQKKDSQLSPKGRELAKALSAALHEKGF